MAQGTKSRARKPGRNKLSRTKLSKTKFSKTKARLFDLASHPATAAMIARATGCNKPPILWRKIGDSWMKCFLKSDCTYGNCQEVDEGQVPEVIRNGASE